MRKKIGVLLSFSMLLLFPNPAVSDCADFGRMTSFQVQDNQTITFYSQNSPIAINGTPPDLIFADMRLAGMNGLELAKQIKRDFPGTRIAMLTGYDFPEYRRVASQHGVDRIFVKDSVDWREIKEFLQDISEDNR